MGKQRRRHYGFIGRTLTLCLVPLVSMAQQAVPAPAPAKAAATPAPAKAAAKPAPAKAAAVPAPKGAAGCCAPDGKKPAAPQVAARKGPPRGPIEKYDCKIGTEDEHARIALLAQGGEVQSVAYYSKWKPRTCSVHLQRGDAFSKWSDTGNATIITTEFGDFLIETSKAEYHMFFREVDRMHYCGMMGKLTGSILVTRTARPRCIVEGIMDRSDIDKDPAVRTDAKPRLPDKVEKALAAHTGRSGVDKPPSDTPPPIATITPPGPPLPPEALKLKLPEAR